MEIFGLSWSTLICLGLLALFLITIERLKYSKAISGWVGLGWDGNLCKHLFYEHRSTVLIIIYVSRLGRVLGVGEGLALADRLSVYSLTVFCSSLPFAHFTQQQQLLLLKL